MGEILKGPLETSTGWDQKEHEPIKERAINSILYDLGLEKRDDIDAFDSLGLRSYRSNNTLLKAYRNN